MILHRFMPLFMIMVEGSFWHKWKIQVCLTESSENLLIYHFQFAGDTLHLLFVNCDDLKEDVFAVKTVLKCTKDPLKLLGKFISFGRSDMTRVCVDKGLLGHLPSLSNQEGGSLQLLYLFFILLLGANPISKAMYDLVMKRIEKKLTLQNENPRCKFTQGL